MTPPIHEPRGGARWATAGHAGVHAAGGPSPFFVAEPAMYFGGGSDSASKPHDKRNHDELDDVGVDIAELVDSGRAESADLAALKSTFDAVRSAGAGKKRPRLTKFIEPLDNGKLACAICSREFKWKASCVRHITCVHAGIKNFTCPHCAKSFKVHHGLKYHLRTESCRARAGNAAPSAVGGDEVQQEAQEQEDEEREELDGEEREELDGEEQEEQGDSHLDDFDEVADGKEECGDKRSDPQPQPPRAAELAAAGKSCGAAEGGEHGEHDASPAPPAAAAATTAAVKVEKAATAAAKVDKSGPPSTQGVAGFFPCPICSKSFAMLRVMTRHIKTVHDNVDAFKCPDCPKKFKSKQGLRYHEKRAHTVQLSTGLELMPTGGAVNTGGWRSANLAGHGESSKLPAYLEDHRHDLASVAAVIYAEQHQQEHKRQQHKQQQHPLHLHQHVSPPKELQLAHPHHDDGQLQLQHQHQQLWPYHHHHQAERSAQRYYATGQPRASRAAVRPSYLEQQRQQDVGPLPFSPSTPSAARAALSGGAAAGGLISPSHLSASRRRSSLSSYGSSRNSFSDIFPCDLAAIPLPVGKDLPKGAAHVAAQNASHTLDDFAEHALYDRR